jgi:hypothetical protein
MEVSLYVVAADRADLPYVLYELLGWLYVVTIEHYLIVEEHNCFGIVKHSKYVFFMERLYFYLSLGFLTAQKVFNLKL